MRNLPNNSNTLCLLRLAKETSGLTYNSIKSGFEMESEGADDDPAQVDNGLEWD